MIALTLAQVAAAVGGVLHDAPDPAVRVTGPAASDSRAVEPGGLFVAITGARVDGHDYVPGALAAGAVGVLATRPVGAPAIVVPDVVAALGRFAQHVLSQLNVRVLAVTGSSGKTTTKDLLAHVLAQHGETVATPGSFNTEVGLPLTVLRAGASTRYLVLEMGARHRGDISYLATLTPPTVGVVLNVGTAHIGEFGSRAAIAEAKSELVQALPSADHGGLAVLNADDDLVAAMATRTTANVLTYGTSPAAQVRATDIRVDSGRAAFTLHTPDGHSARVSLHLLGAHQVHNALAVAGAALGVGMTTDAIAHALSTAVPASGGRLEILERGDGVTIINDAFNANPDSVHAALNTLASLAHGHRRTIVVLGDMRELGDTATTAHHDIGTRVAVLGVDILVTVGDTPDMHTLTEAARHTAPALRIEAVDGPDTLHTLLTGLLARGDILLIKASRSVGLETFGNTLHAAV